MMRGACHFFTLAVPMRLPCLLPCHRPDDGLVADITDEYRQHRAVYEAKARKLTAEQVAVAAVAAVAAAVL
jgi:hypothetical protein